MEKHETFYNYIEDIKKMFEEFSIENMVANPAEPVKQEEPLDEKPLKEAPLEEEEEEELYREEDVVWPSGLETNLPEEPFNEEDLVWPSSPKTQTNHQLKKEPHESDPPT